MRRLPSCAKQLTLRKSEIHDQELLRSVGRLFVNAAKQLKKLRRSNAQVTPVQSHLGWLEATKIE